MSDLVCVSYNVRQCLALLVSQFQAIIWGTLSLLGILLYNGDIEMKESQRDSKKFEIALAFMYFERTRKCMA